MILPPPNLLRVLYPSVTAVPRCYRYPLYLCGHPSLSCMLHPSISCMLTYSAIPTIFVRYFSIHSVPSPIMNRLRAIPDRASIVEFTFKQNSNGRLVQQHIPMGRPEHVSEGGRPTSPRKRQRMGADYDYPIQMADDAFVYLDHDLPQHSGSVKISFNLLHFNLLSSHSDNAGLYSGMDPSPRPTNPGDIGS